MTKFSKEVQKQATIDLIRNALQDAVLDIEFIDRNQEKIAISRVRFHMLLATLRNTITHLRSLEAGFRDR
jgi:hypothetical protein